MLPQVKKQLGFTLIEVIVVIALLAILATIVLVAINPAQNSADARNTKRRADVLEILNSVNQYYVARGAWPTNMPASGGAPVAIKSSATATPGDICQDPAPATTNIVPTYIAAFPFDPTAAGAQFTSCTNYNTGYTIALSAGNRVTVAAPSAEGTTISVTR